MRPPRAICFDFDGVILESLDIKARAFRELFSEHPRHADAIVDYHNANAGMPRYDKFRYFYEELLRRPMPAGEMERLDARFSALVFKAVLDCPWVPGALEFLRSYRQALPLYVVSATPEPELRRIIEGRGLGGYFRAVYGSPKDKKQNLAALLAGHRLEPSAAVSIGDGSADYEAAQAAGVPFIARVTPGKRPYWESRGVAMIEDLRPLAETLGLKP
ncbi:MAG: HAD family hydrolase [Elusimicrobia bacterium]|nr:HAD family hydrolase [Elusimicrobiota bacterium]MDE2237819.1 HAD family hydrolase [Elusimicrobiota bacterium]MDE2426933.1 HAD family hydrolase [Elusimicrobiota bacterium]